MAISWGPQASAQVFDVKVLAFPAASARTVQGLMQLFNIDRAAAERLITGAPLLLAQQVGGPDAEAYAQALRKLGARVVVEPSGGAAPQEAHWSQPSELEEDLLPQPRAMPVANDTELEYDVLSAQEPGYVAHASISTSLRAPLDMDLGTSEPDRMAEDKSLRRPRQESIDLQADYGNEGSLPGLELDAPAPARERERKPKPQAERARAEPREPAAAPQPAARPRSAEATATGPHARAAVVQHTVEEETSRTLPLLQLCLAMLVFAIGYWADSSVIFGSASLWSVGAHGVAFYQLILGVRGLVS